MDHNYKRIGRWLRTAGLAVLICHLPLGLTACSEEDDSVDDYANWQQRNEAFFASLQDSLQGSPASWVRLKCYSLDETTEGAATDYVYCKKIRLGTGTASPMFTDSVRVSYQGRLLPTATWPQGYVFDGTAYNEHYDDATNATKKMVMAANGSEVLISGWITALLHMHQGDYWRIYVPSTLGYGDTDHNGIPAWSTLIFDITLVDFSPAGHPMAAWSSRMR